MMSSLPPLIWLAYWEWYLSERHNPIRVRGQALQLDGKRAFLHGFSNTPLERGATARSAISDERKAVIGIAGSIQAHARKLSATPIPRTWSSKCNERCTHCRLTDYGHWSRGSHDQLRRQLTDFVTAYDLGRRLKPFRGIAPSGAIGLKEPVRFSLRSIERLGDEENGSGDRRPSTGRCRTTNV